MEGNRQRVDHEGEGMSPSPAQRLLDDSLEEVLRRVPPRGLAACRCVCAAWRAIVDARRLLSLNARLLPRSVTGIFVNFYAHNLSEMFYRSNMSPSFSSPGPVSGWLDFLPSGDDRSKVQDHCNGLLLLDGHVANPTTERWDRLTPPPPPPSAVSDEVAELLSWDSYIAYDPTMSVHYEVLRIARVPFMSIQFVEMDPVIDGSEWPPSPLVLQVLSSRTGEWEERPFHREGEAAGTFADMRSVESVGKRHAACWLGNLYVHCQNNFFLRISLSGGEYRVIQPPKPVNKKTCSSRLYLGKSKTGIHLAYLNYDRELRVWILDESHARAEWVLKHQNNISNLLPRRDPSSWKMEDINYYAATEEWRLHWVHYERPYASYYYNANYYNGRTEDDIKILGFHPFEEVVFLSASLGWGLSYHWNGSELRYLGSLYPTCYNAMAGPWNSIETSFIYTPCWIQDFPANSIYESSIEE